MLILEMWYYREQDYKLCGGYSIPCATILRSRHSNPVWSPHTRSPSHNLKGETLRRQKSAFVCRTSAQAALFDIGECESKADIICTAR